MKNVFTLIGTGMMALSAAVLGYLNYDGSKQKRGYILDILLKHKPEIISEWWYDVSQKKYIYWPNGDSIIPLLISDAMNKTGLGKDSVTKIMTEIVSQWIIEITLERRHEEWVSDSVIKESELITSRSGKYTAICMKHNLDTDWIRDKTDDHTLIAVMPTTIVGGGAAGYGGYGGGSGSVCNQVYGDYKTHCISYETLRIKNKWIVCLLRGEKTLRDIFDDSSDYIIECDSYDDARAKAEKFINSID